MKLRTGEARVQGESLTSAMVIGLGHMFEEQYWHPETTTAEREEPDLCKPARGDITLNFHPFCKGLTLGVWSQCLSLAFFLLILPFGRCDLTLRVL